MTKKRKINILIPDFVKPPTRIEQQVFGAEAEVFLGEASKAEEISDEMWGNCHAILAWEKLQYDKQLLAKLKKCKVIVRVGVGYDNIDLLEATSRGIVICNVPDYGTQEVADHTLALLLSLARGLFEFAGRVQQRKWQRQNPIPFRLKHKVFGVIGLGRIGSAVALRAKAFDLRVIFYDPYKADGYDKALGIERVETLEELAAKADIVSIHAPLTEETHNMVNDQFFDKAKTAIVLINTARGAIIDLAALRRAMKKEKVKAAGLDVLPQEPSDDKQQLIVDWENDQEWLRGRLIVTPHVAFYSPEAYQEMRQKAAQEALRVLKGEKARNRVN